MYLLRLMLLRVWAISAIAGFGVEMVMSVAFASNATQPRQIEQSPELSDVASADVSALDLTQKI